VCGRDHERLDSIGTDMSTHARAEFWRRARLIDDDEHAPA
jgi:hypothetical protein